MGEIVEEENGKKGGEILFCGSTEWNTLGKKGLDSKYKLCSPTRLRPLLGIHILHVASGPVSSHCVALDVDGRCYTWGRNQNGQLGHGDTLNRDFPTLVSQLSKYKIVMASAGRSNTVVVTDDGQSLAFGWNKHGQLGSGSLKKEVETSPVLCQVSDVTTVACGGEFTVWLSSAQGASILSAGLPQYGQLGHGTDGEFNTKESSVKLAYEPQPHPKAIASLSGETIVKVACGINHSVAVDSNGFVYTWGSGDYGRLGHREQKDEFLPRRVDVFTRHNVLPPDAIISAGGLTSACTAAEGQLYMWGKIKNTGDAWMYPKPVMDMCGWKLRCMDSGDMFHFVGADSSCISWGQALSGELGYGLDGQKTSANPKKVDILEGMHVISVACGFGHSMVVVDRTDVIDRLDQLDVYGEKTSEEDNEISKPVISAKKTPKKVAAENSKKRKKSETSGTKEEEGQDTHGGGGGGDEDGEEETTNGNLEKTQRGAKSGGRSRDRGNKKTSEEGTEISKPVISAKKTPKKVAADNSKKRTKTPEETKSSGWAGRTRGRPQKS